MTIDPKFHLQKLRKYVGMIGAHVVRETAPASDLRMVEPDEPRFGAPPDDLSWKPTRLEESWGAKQQWTSFRGTVRVPEHWATGALDVRVGSDIRYLEDPGGDNTPAGPEGQVFINGERWGALDKQHSQLRYPFELGREYDVRAVLFAARCACRHVLTAFEVVWVDAATEKLFHDLRVALDVAEQLSETSLARTKLLGAVEAACHAANLREHIEAPLPRAERRDPESAGFYASVASAQEAFDAAMGQMQGAAEVPEIVSVGHAHIDLAWLWPIKQTRHKCVRTFATQCRLLDQYGDWVFLQSQPQAYKWVEQDAPELFDQMRAQIEAGRWEAEGAFWVESDTNLPSGESLVRQLLYGKRYFREKLGVDSRFLWLPDVFGYTAALPQLMKLANVDAFVTSKISWSQYNRFPHDTFRWRGLDGTEVPTHFITTPCGAWFLTYNAMMTAAELKRNWEEYRQKSLLIDPLLTFGFGDGGGGPTEEMLESANRLATMPMPSEMPKVKFETARALVDRVVSRAADLPVWDGELYLEYHRGTYTTQAWLKRANRKNEINLHNVEWLASLAAPHGFALDKPKLDAMWEDLLLMQFHDILPGSSVGEVYDDEIRPMQEAIEAQCREMIAGAVDALCAKIDTTGFAKPVVLFNTLSWDRTDPVRMPDGSWRDGVTVPAGGWAVVELAGDASDRSDPSDPSDAPWVSTCGRELTNRFWELHLDEQGRVARLYDRLNSRDVLPTGGAANDWQVFEDRPLAHEAWDVDLYYQEYPLPRPECVSVEVIERGGARAAVELVWRMPPVGEGPQSVITQRIALYASGPRIDFETVIDWHDHHQLLKVAFPVDVRATDATYQIQFGHLKRPAHWNTSWDLAKFEACGHQFVDLSEHGYGVSLLNDCKYGHDIRDGVIRLTCVKSAQSPHMRADQGRHEFTYSLLPHAGTFQEAGVIRAAAELNVPVIAVEAEPAGGELPAEFALVRCDSEAVVIDTVKPAEDGDGLILRLYESHGSHADATLTFAALPASIETVDLLEGARSEDVELGLDGAAVRLRLRPFEVVSLRIHPEHPRGVALLTQPARTPTIAG